MTIVSEFSDEGFSGKNTFGATGHKCSFRLNIEQTEMNRMVAAIISAMVKDKRFKDAIKAKMGTAVDTSEMEERIEALCTQLKQVQGIKTRLEHQMDNLDVTDAHYNKKISDLQRRYDEQYDKAENIETQMDEWNNRLLSVRQEKISADNVYQLLLAFDKLYNTFTEVEQRDFMRAFIERIDIYLEKLDNGCWIRNIVFNFPMPVQEEEIKSLPLESKSTVETVALLSKLSEAKHHINVKVDMDELDLTSAEAKVTYKEIEEWVQEMYGFHVTNLNIAQVK